VETSTIDRTCGSHSSADAYADVAEQKYPDDPKRRTEIADRLEGKAVQLFGDVTAGNKRDPKTSKW
jgi:hypothetical protein